MVFQVDVVSTVPLAAIIYDVLQHTVKSTN